MLGTGRTPKFLKPVDVQPLSPLGKLVADIEKTTSATALWKMFDRVIMMGGDVASHQMKALEATWTTRYTLVCRQYGVHS
jgi:hypothetical protein